MNRGHRVKMRKWGRWMRIILALVLAVTVMGGEGADPAGAASAAAYATYVSPEKIAFVSYSRSWNQAKLKALYVDLLRNLHGEELAYLGKVVLSAEDKEGEAGVAHIKYSWTKDDGSDIVMEKGTEIVLYGANRLTTVAELSATLSHEYGHHFTHYWLIKKERKLPSDPRTKWASIRGIKGKPVVFTEDASEPGYSHKWDAGDYGGRLYGAVRLADGQAGDGRLVEAGGRPRLLR